MLRSAQPSQFSTYPSQYIDTPGLAVLMKVASQTIDNMVHRILFIVLCQYLNIYRMYECMYEVLKVVDCEKQNYAPEGEPLHQIVDEFADHQDVWFRVSRYFM